MADRDPPGPGSGEPGQVRPLIQWDDDLPTNQPSARGFSHSQPNTAEPTPAHNTTLGAIEQMPSQPNFAEPPNYPETPQAVAGSSASPVFSSIQPSLVTRATERSEESTLPSMQPLATTQYHPLSPLHGEGASNLADKTSAPTCREPVGAAPNPPRTSAASNVPAHLSVAGLNSSSRRSQ